MASARIALGLGLLGGATAVAIACSLTGLADGTRDAGVEAAAGTAGCTGIGCGGSGGSAGGCDGGAGCAGGGAAGSSSCADGAKNGNESDVDCGGGCATCAVGRACNEASDCKTGVCTGDACACPTGMVLVPTPIPEGVPYCVDATEVTNEQYDVFLKSNPDAAQQPPECDWNTSFDPSNFATALANKPQHPVVSLDWCDARAYCAAAGKRLCGKLGGGAHVFSLPQSGTNEWYVACSRAGTRTYVYGGTYDPSACADENFFGDAGGSTREVGSLDKCEGGYAGIFDMNGNVWEWEDSCNDVDGGDAAATSCRRRGGAYDDTEFCARCATCGSASRARSNKSGATGFRCCAG
jgi:hypothetical protein